MKIKSGDKVKIITGKDKGKTGKVLHVLLSAKKVTVEGLNLSVKHMRPKKRGEKGQKIEFPSPINVSNVQIVCPKCNKASRIKSTVIQKGDKKKNVRMCGKCKELID